MTTTMGKPSILIADDDPACRETLRDIVEPAGYKTFLVSSGEEAIEVIHHESIQLALFDMHMNRLTGVETVQIVHSINATLPCILVTADATEEVMRQAFKVRVYSVIPKPVSRNVLLYTMVRALVQVHGQAFPKQEEPS